MTDSRRRDQRDRSRPDRHLGAADFEAAPYADVSAGRQARSQIHTPRNQPDKRLSSSGRRLSRDERRKFQDQYRAKTTTPASTRRRTTRTPSRGRTGMVVKLGGLICVSIILIAIGSGRFFGGRGEATASPTPVTQPVSVLASPVATQPPLPTPTIEPTLPPTPTPFIDPRYVGKVVCLDPGHGGSDRGFKRDADSAAPAMEEATYNLAFARAVKVRLEARGFTVVMTHETDEDVNKSGADVNGDGKTAKNGERAKMIDELQARINVCNNAHANLLVSMHINGFDDPAVSGYETWYSSARPFTPLNKLFATIAFDELGRQMHLAGYNAAAREVNDDATAHVDIGRDAFDRYVITGPAQKGQIKPSEMPGAIVEVLFISNDQDAAFMASNAGRNAIVTAYEHAIMRYFDDLPDTVTPTASAVPTHTPDAEEPKH
ncbi:MAG TPA: N-acetylmuramoyl-L-alanine amidase [Thermomicrobiales bacterium]|nr:N-acetylmuramoyl-L-alanine amidase [Thermomicrobiales bacterium]